jgi:cytosolic carboxypeptidase protein 2/3
VHCPYVRQLSLGRTLTGLDVPLLHITNHQNETKKKMVVITARVHPGETNSSYMVKGLIEYMLGESKDVEELRNTTHVFVVPMLNPDGVVMGNTRTSAAGRDLNR